MVNSSLNTAAEVDRLTESSKWHSRPHKQGQIIYRCRTHRYNHHPHIMYRRGMDKSIKTGSQGLSAAGSKNEPSPVHTHYHHHHHVPLFPTPMYSIIDYGSSSTDVHQWIAEWTLCKCRYKRWYYTSNGDGGTATIITPSSANHYRCTICTDEWPCFVEQRFAHGQDCG